MNIDNGLRIRVRSLPLAACLVAALAAPHADGESTKHPSPAAAVFPTQLHRPSDVLPVTSCLDDGSPGTLRSVVAQAASGDTVDMTQLTCGTITLASGAIPIIVGDLTLQGPGADVLTIDGADADRVINHSVAGALTISAVAITHGHYESGAVLGGCIYSVGDTILTATTVSSCSTSGGSALFAGGGGIAVYGNLTLVASTLSNNNALRPGTGTYLVVGGGAVVSGDATLVDSTISGNAVQGAAGTYGYHTYGGGLVVAGTLAVENSTIAFNTAGRGGGGVFDLGYGIDLQSTIVADNVSTYGYFSADIGGYGTLTGAGNLIMSSDIVVPGDTLNDDPQLLPLADNGGPTPTHALSSASPAIDTGNNAAGLAFDQRGDGYLRVSGLAADIGAFEYQQAFAVPTVAKNFTPDTIAVHSPSTLTITLNNPNPSAATLIADLVDNLPGPVVIADPPDASTTCTNGSVIAGAGGNAVTLAGGAAIPAAGSCTVAVSVTADAIGTYTNTIPAGALQTDLGSDPGAASADLTVTAQAPTLVKAFAPDTVAAGDTTTLTITLTNDNPVAATLAADLADHLPPSLTVADPPDAATTCPGGALDAEPDAGTITLAAGAQIPPSAACTITVAIASVLPGIFTNTIPGGALQTSLGSNPDAANAALTVTERTSEHIFADGFDGAPPAPAGLRLETSDFQGTP